MKPVMTHRRRRREVLAQCELILPTIEVCLLGLPPVTLPAQAMVWAAERVRNGGRMRLGEASWCRVSRLTKRHFVAVPADMSSRERTPDGAPPECPEETVSCYIAAQFLAHGIAASPADDIGVPIPEGLHAPGMGRLMTATAVQMHLMEVRDDLAYLGIRIRTVLTALLSGDESIADMGYEGRTTVCRGWMDAPAAATPSRAAALMMARLSRSVLRDAPAVRFWQSGSTQMHSLDSLPSGPRAGCLLDAGACWHRVLEMGPLHDDRHVVARVEDDDSRVVCGVYLRDSSLLSMLTSEHVNKPIGVTSE